MMNNEVYYVKEKKLSLPVTGIKLTGIPILESIQLSFYQKYIILILQKGFKANGRVDLIERLAQTLNINTACVEDFINFLIKEKNIVFDSKSNIYALKTNICCTIDESHNNVMFAELDTKFADFDKLLFLDNFDEIRLENAFIYKDYFLQKNSPRSQTTLEKIATILPELDGTVKEFIIEGFKNTNFHLKDSIEYKLSNELRPFNIEFNVLVTYKFLKETGKATKVSYDVPKDFNLPNYIVSSLVTCIEEDDKLPRFILLDEPFYEKTISKSESIDDSERYIDSLSNEIEPLKTTVQEQKDQLNKLKKEHKKKLKDLQNEYSKLKEAIAKKDLSIETNESLLEKYKKENKELAYEFKNTIKELSNEKEKLHSDLGLMERELERISSESEAIMQEKNKLIKEQEVIIKEKNKELAKLTIENEKGINSLKTLIGNNLKQLDDKTKEICKKYSNENSLFCRYVQDICLGMDKAISASDCDSITGVIDAIDSVRIKSRKTIQVILDVLLNKNAVNLAEYFATSARCIELEKLFINRKSTSDVMRRVIKYHYLSNATTHLVENGSKAKENKEVIEEFKNSSVNDRRRILSALHDFFLTFDFSAQEKKSFSARLKI